MKRSEWQRAYDPDPVRLEARVRHTLANLDATPAARPRALRTALIAALVLALLGGIALAVYESRTADLAGWFGGEERKDELLSGDIAPSGESTRLGDVIYTLDDVIYKDGTIYGSGVIRAAEGANIVLIDENSGIHEPAGYPLHYGKDYTVPDDAPSYVELAQERGARLILAKCVADGVLDENGEPDSVGYDQIPQPDGTIRFYFEFAGREGGIERAESYDVILSIANWEVTPEGEWYDQDWDEWVVVLEGEARLGYEDGHETTLGRGESLFLPRGLRHRVTYTSSPCLWLAVHADSLRPPQEEGV